MANKLYAMEQLTEEVAKDVAASPQEWMRFLDIASKLYKYTFPEQLLIYAQRPEATAVASMEIWNQKMYRWIKKGSKGIALIDNTSGPKTKLRYVFDVQDTYKVRNLGKDPQLWNLPVEGEHLVADYLQEQLSLEDTEGGLAESLHQAAKESMQEWLPDALEELRLDVTGTFLEELDEQNQEVEFRELMTNSVWYVLLNRCGLDVQEYLDAEDFRHITDFNQLKILGHLGSAVNEISRPVLMQIGRYVLKDLESSYVTVSRVSQILEEIRRVDYTAFYRESLDMEHIDVMGKETIHLEYLPDIILMPNVGIRGVMWQEIEGKRRNSPGRMVFSIFHLEDLKTTFTHLTGEFRWELCKRVQGNRWNDVSISSLTSEYFDYIQFYRKNHDLSTEAKEKVKSSLQRAKNSFKEMFVRDYMIWVLFEGAGSPRLNKVARQIMFTYCPFPEDICNTLTQNPLYADLLDRRKIKVAQGLHHLDVLTRKLQNGNIPVPETVAQERYYLSGSKKA